MERDQSLIIDRIEGDIAVCENAERCHIELKLSEISGPAREGDILRPELDDGYTVDTTATAQRREKMMRRQNKLFGKQPD